MVDATLKSKVDTILETLPPSGQEELDQFLDFLVKKYQVEPKRNILVLSGFWKDTPLNVTDEEMRKLREEVSRQLLEKFDSGLSKLK